ncbi:hypothetical protein RQP46_002410 [Phenoliferia psychrophenolica]
MGNTESSTYAQYVRSASQQHERDDADRAELDRSRYCLDDAVDQRRLFDVHASYIYSDINFTPYYDTGYSDLLGCYHVSDRIETHPLQTYPAACCPNTLVPMQKVASTAKRTQSTSWPLNWMRFANHDITSGGDPVANYTGLATETDCMQISVGWDGATGVDVPYKSAAFLYSGGCSDAAVQAMADSAPPGSKFTPDQIQDLQNDCANVGSDLSAPVPASSGPSYTRTPYFNAAGGDITSFTGLPDEAACHDACTSSPDCIGVIWQLYNTDEPSSLCYLKSSVGVLNNGTDGAQPFCVFAGKDDEEYFTAVSSIDASTQTDTASTPLSTSTQTVYSEAPTPPASLTTSTVYVEAPTPTSTNVVSGSTPIASSVSVSYVQAATPGTTTTSTAYAQSTACAVNNVAPVTTCPSGLLLVTANVATLAKLTTVKLLGGGRPVTVDCGSAGTYTY